MKIKYVRANYNKDFFLNEDFFNIVEEKYDKNSTFALFSSIQFLDNLETVKTQLENRGFNIVLSKPSRCFFNCQILGCNSYEDNFDFDFSKIDGFIYIGDGFFHPKALLLAQENREKFVLVIRYNPIENKTQILDKSFVNSSFLKKRANLAKFYLSKNVGVFISTKFGQENKDLSKKLEVKYKNKNFYFFVGDNFSNQEMENFCFVDCFVNSACPRIGQDDILEYKIPIVNLKDVL